MRAMRGVLTREMRVVKDINRSYAGPFMALALVLVSTLLSGGACFGAVTDCVGRNTDNGAPGRAQCVPPIAAPYGSGAAADGWTYTLDSDVLSYMNDWATWCVALGGTVEGRACYGLDDFHFSEQDLVPAAISYWNTRAPSCGPWMLESDSGWVFPTTLNNIVVRNTRSIMVSGLAGCSSTTLSAIRIRKIGCPVGYAARAKIGGQSGEIECWRLQQQCFGGDGIRASDGANIKIDVDVAPLSPGGLTFSRTFVSTGYFSATVGENGGEPQTANSYWRHTGQRRVVPLDSSTALAAIQAENGRVRYFDSAGYSLDEGTSSGDMLERVLSATGELQGWRYRSGGLGFEEYNDVGQLTRTVGLTGSSMSVHYSDANTSSSIAPRVGLPIHLVDAFGRSLHLGYDVEGRLTSVADANGNVVGYQYDASGNPSSVVLPDGAARIYSYSDSRYPHFITGAADENGNAFASWTYDYSQNGYSPSIVTMERAGGVGRRHMSTTMVSNGNASGIETDPLGQQRGYYFYSTVNGISRMTSQSQPGGSGCSASSNGISYDANGNVASSTDFDSHKTCFSYDLTRSLQTKRVEGLSSGANCTTALASPPTPTASYPTRVVSTTWHPDWRLEARRAEPKKLTTWVYNGQPDPSAGNATAACAPASALLPDGKPIAVLCKTIEQATTDATGAAGFAATTSGSPRISTWTYNGYGQTLTATDPLGHTTTYTYYGDTTADHTLGDLASVRNPAGHLTTYPRYDRNGRLLEMHDANGLVTTYSYSPRGWLTSRQVGSELTGYSYDAVGQLKKVTAPDGSWIGYDYDPAHRLTDIYDQSGNRITYTLDAAGNRTQEVVKDPAGNLVRTHSRVYDALSRLQNIVQPASAQ